MARDGQYGVDATISVDVNVSIVVNASDEVNASEKVQKICERLAGSFYSRLQETLKVTKQEVKELDDITETYHQDTEIENVEEIEAPVTDEEEE